MKKEYYLHYSGLKVARDGEVWIPKSGTNPEHYTYGSLMTDGHRIVSYRGKPYLVHVLVAEVFLNNNQPIDTKVYAVHHKDENPANNKVDNLLIITHPEHRRLHMTGRVVTNETKLKMSEAKRGEKGPRYGKFGADNPSSIPIIGINKTTGEVREFVSQSEASTALRIDQSNISRCCKGIYKSTGGWQFKYAQKQP